MSGNYERRRNTPSCAGVVQALQLWRHLCGESANDNPEPVDFDCPKRHFMGAMTSGWVAIQSKIQSVQIGWTLKMSCCQCHRVVLLQVLTAEIDTARRPWTFWSPVNNCRSQIPGSLDTCNSSAVCLLHDSPGGTGSSKYKVVLWKPVTGPSKLSWGALERAWGHGQDQQRHC